MEGNPVWSLPEYSYHLVTTLQKLTVLDQQEVSAEVRTNAQKWKASQLGKNFRLCSVSERGIHKYESIHLALYCTLI